MGGKKEVIDGINYMRAEISSKMIGKHKDEWSSYKKCRNFMRNICRPGNDNEMDGDSQERSTANGWCTAFFPVQKDSEETKAEKNVRHSSYDRQRGVILGKAIEGHDEKISPVDAEALCEELGDKCAGFTCCKDRKECTVRGPGTLKDSVSGEVSYVKPSFDPSEH